jgi:hypothetical protein
MYDYIKKAVDSGDVMLEWDYSKGQVSVAFLDFCHDLSLLRSAGAVLSTASNVTITCAGCDLHIIILLNF